MRPTYRTNRYAEADARLRAAALALIDYLNEHDGVARGNSKVVLELRQAWLAAERKKEHLARMKQR